MEDENHLALYGGKPIRDTYLPYARQWIDDEDIEAVVDVLKSDFITTGPSIAKFEEGIASYVGANYAVAFSSGTAALHAACAVADIQQGDEVITTPMTFAASANCILYRKGIPVFADINPQTHTIAPDSIESLINDNTKAIITVDFTGQPADYDNILRLADEHGLLVIDDAAHALGATYNKYHVGSIGDMTIFSFHPVKHITSGEGGMITTNNKHYYEALQRFRSHGIIRDPDRLQAKHASWYYEIQELGYNYRMNDMQAALGFSQLQKLPAFLQKRKEYAARYNQAFEAMEQLITPLEQRNTNASWHLYVLRLNLEQLTASRTEIVHALQQENIGVNVHYIPVNLHPFYQQLGYKQGICPHAERLYQEIMTLPLFPKMTDQDVYDVIAAVRKVIAYYSRE